MKIVILALLLISVGIVIIASIRIGDINISVDEQTLSFTSMTFVLAYACVIFAVVHAARNEKGKS